jgi:hypothetical protein
LLTAARSVTVATTRSRCEHAGHRMRVVPPRPLHQHGPVDVPRLGFSAHEKWSTSARQKWSGRGSVIRNAIVSRGLPWPRLARASSSRPRSATR